MRIISFFLLACLIASAVGNPQPPAPGEGIDNFVAKLQEACGRADREVVNDLAAKMIGHLVGPPVVLPTPAVGPDGDRNVRQPNPEEGFIGLPEGGNNVMQETQELFGGWCDQAERAMNVLRECPAAAEAFDTLAKITDVAFNFAQLTVNPNIFWLPQGQSFPVTNAGFTPFVFGRNGYFEKSYEGTIPAGGGAFVMKEFFGIKAIVFRDRIPFIKKLGILAEELLDGNGSTMYDTFLANTSRVSSTSTQIPAMLSQAQSDNKKFVIL
eukprot:CAMPEP_0168528002 /NCGR_PEP_ID=MMETSP0405-20121227/12975_1 /TAXON_ID=498012 /ORGANISM="Trichosphaerium sp, Strain Am-I-7 wt" /LENGTH=267 /DNA_ID=CAMNT_0008551295 /DNA_START=22 /DNA_END=822 /DNA_ORIENTATION=+